MNYYQYKKRVPETRKKSDYIKPFIVLVIFVAIIFAAWKLLSALFGGTEEPIEVNETVQVELETGSAKIMTSGSKEWKSIPASVEVIQGEKLQTLSDGRISLGFFDGSKARLDDNSTLAIDTLKDNDTSAEVALTLQEGNLWADLTSKDSAFTVKTDILNVKANSGSKFALSAPGSLYVLEGTLEADIMDDTTVLKSVKVTKGQQIAVTSSVVSDLSDGLDKTILFALDENFKTSEWYRWNQQKDGVTISDEEVTPTDETTDDTEKDDNENKDDEDKDKEDSADADGPETPQITSPGKNGEEVTLTKVDQFISGTVSEDTQKVKVNDYTLNQYVPGSGKFTYKASASTIKNLVVGNNTFIVTAYDKDDNKSKSAQITLILPQKVFDDAGLKEDEKKDEPSSSTGGVSISSPNGGQNLTTSETSFTISGTVPDKTAVVKVNNYQLQAYTAGSTTFKYNANTTVGTLKMGQKNTYTVQAFDAQDALLGSASMTIDTTGSENTQTPKPSTNDAFSVTINLPTTAAAYDTTLNQITLGGAVTGSPEAVYVNGNEVDNYAPGLDKWSTLVTLTPGLNNFSVYSEKDGQSSSSDTLAVTYKN